MTSSDAVHVAAGTQATFDPPLDTLVMKTAVAGGNNLQFTIGSGTYSLPSSRAGAHTIITGIGPISGVEETGSNPKTATYIAIRNTKHVVRDVITGGG